ncbi:asparagine synthase C-terminal domain-containing protein [Candidatus Nitrosotenuis aquarius]|uniref:asparagine synthase C-terminal domain-containing protein n=1 Tax=Candidatus Nitrosotenuis aquarius TaxID=1846278 RepID=UPI000C1F6FBF|nr:asparagine synthase C-terminal domain-containing protein [Candidatus Nitrosotenuis aquarius]
MNLGVLLEKIKSAITQTVPSKKIGIAFSGGVDSTLIAKLCNIMNYDVTLLTIGFADSHDIKFAKQVNEFLKLPHHVLEINPDEFDSISKKINTTINTDNLSWNENSIAFYHVSKLAQSLGLDMVVTANGIDELFCGYNGYRDAIKQGNDAVMVLMDAKLDNEINMMRAINQICFEFGVKIVQPLLSEDFIKFAKTIPIDQKITDENDLQRKHIIRKLAIEVGVPDLSANARKKALQYGSMIHKALLKSR